MSVKTIKLSKETKVGDRVIKTDLELSGYDWANDSVLISKLFQFDGANIKSTDGPITSYGSLSNSMIREIEGTMKVKTSENPSNFTVIATAPVQGL